MNMPILPQFQNTEQSISIDGAVIHQDQHGRFCLNDLHKASGAAQKDQPRYFLENQQTQGLINALIDSGIPLAPVEVIRGGLNQGTYVVKQIVYAYAMWISPSFNLKVINTFDALVTQKPQLPQTFAEALQLAADQARQLELAAPKVQYFDRVADTKNLLNASQVGKKVGMSAVKLNQHLADMGVYDRRIAGRTFAQWFIDKGYGEVKQTEQGYPQSKFTNKGEQWVIEQLVSEGVVQ